MSKAVVINKQNKSQARRIFLSFIVLALMFIANPLVAQSLAQIDSLNALPQTIQDDINRLCLPSHYRDGAAAYRNCVASEIDYRNSDSAIITDDYSFDEKFAIQQTCESSVESASGYLNCVRNETQKLDAIVNPELGELSKDERSALHLSCYEAGKVQSAANYRKCTNTALEDIQSIPQVNLSQLSAVERTEIISACTDASRQKLPGNYRLCTAEALADILKLQREARANSELMVSDITTPESELGIAPASTSNDTNLSTDMQPLAGEDSDDQVVAETEGEVSEAAPSEAAPSEAERTNEAEPVTAVFSDVEINTESTTAAPEEVEAATESLATVPDVVETIESSAAAAFDEAETESIVAIPDVTETDTDSTAVATEAVEIATGDTNLTITNGDDSSGLPEIQAPTVQVTTTNPAPESTFAAAPDEPSVEVPAPLVELAELPTLDDKKTSFQSGENPQAALPTLAAFKENPVEFVRTLEPQHYAYYLKYLLPILIILVALKLLRIVLRRRKRAKGIPEYQSLGIPDDEFNSLLDDPAFTTAPRKLVPPPDLSAPLVEPQLQSNQSSQPEDLARAPDFGFLDDPTTGSSEYDSDRTSKAALLDQTLFTPVYCESDFGQWIHQQPTENHKRLCTEFMLYWVSYGDGNYTPEMKDELLRAVDLNEHDLIKKWVLEQNPSTLVDMLQRVWSIFSKVEVEQTISMMFAVLVKNEISPVQNTFFRFLADFAHIGCDGLNRLHVDSFGTPLPVVPRPDDERWWQRRASQIASSNSVVDPAMDQQNPSDRIICLTLLGLPESAGQQEIKNVYAQISSRCNPARFDRLGEKERGLVQRHLAKYTQAYDYLLEVAG